MKELRDDFKEAFGFSEEQIDELFSSNEFKILKTNKYIEDDNSITLALDDYDIVVNQPTYRKAFRDAMNELDMYLKDYVANIDYWKSDEDRKNKIMNIIKELKIKINK